MTTIRLPYPISGHLAVDLHGEKVYNSYIRNGPALLVTAGTVSHDGVSVMTSPILSPDSDNLKRCSKCGGQFPATTEYFYRKLKGLQSICIPCAREQNRQYREDNADKLRQLRKENSAHRSARASAWNKANPERVAENCRRYRENHPEDVKRRSHARYERNREQRLEYAKEKYWRELGTQSPEAKERRREYERQYRAKNKIKIANSTRLWRTANPDKTRAQWQRRYARKKAAEGTTSAADLAAIRAAQTDKQGRLICWICNKPITDSPHLDHWIPLADDGTHNPGNLHYTHAWCNQSKGGKHPIEIGRLL